MKKRTGKQTKVKRYEYRIVKNNILKNSELLEYRNNKILEYWNIHQYAGKDRGTTVKTDKETDKQTLNGSNSRMYNNKINVTIQVY
ncbi:MAG: hypothetical protein LBP85_03515 [Prevotellaceae bacterium]|nr:hypothetical protein [Prevotellaceae bacterium]